MVNTPFTLLHVFPAHITEGFKAPFDTLDLVAQVPSRSNFRHEIGPSETAKIRLLRGIPECPALDLPLEHETVDKHVW